MHAVWQQARRCSASDTPCQQLHFGLGVATSQLCGCIVSVLGQHAHIETLRGNAVLGGERCPRLTGQVLTMPGS